MVEIKIQHPYINENGVEKANLIKHYAEDENGVRYYIKQVETGVEYSEAIDVFPCKYTYVATDKKIEEQSPIEDGFEIA